MGGFTFCLNTDRCINYSCSKRLDLPKRKFLEHKGIHVNKLYFDCVQERRFNMGTNYYLHIGICESCKRPQEVKHLGKSSGGWKFLFHKQKGMENYKDFIGVVESCVHNGAKIYDEYDQEIPYLDFIKIINSSQQDEHQLHAEVIDGYDFWDGDFD